MVSMSSLHTMTAELHTGFLVLAFIGIGGTFLLQILVWRERPRFFLSSARRARGYLEAAGLVGAVLGVVALVLSAVTGSLSWSTGMLLDSPGALNKIILTSISMVIWAGAVFIRLRFGRGLWTCPAMAGLYAGLSLIGIGLVAVSGAMGAKLTKGESMLDWFWGLIGIDPLESFLISDTFAILLSVLAVIITLACLVYARRSGLSTQSFECSTGSCRYWDEPRIGS
jgi:hypothetical protein